MVEYCGHTDVGRRRSLNEDTIHAEDRLFVVCDGMGGHKAGLVASKLAVEAIARFIRRSDTGMGTTVVAAMVSPRNAEVTYAHVGDSRIYLIRGGSMQQLTRDDTWANLANGADLDATSPMKNVLTKALGAREDVDFEVTRLALERGDLILLCSDGLTNMLSDERIHEIVVARSPELEAVCRDLVAAANEQGGRDNISVVVVHSTS